MNLFYTKKAQKVYNSCGNKSNLIEKASGDFWKWFWMKENQQEDSKEDDGKCKTYRMGFIKRRGKPTLYRQKEVDRFEQL